MKKLVSLLLAVCMCLSVGVMLMSCDEEHTHTYKTEWAKDTTHHWHDCEGENCLEFSDKAEHVWNEGEVTIESTAEADGEKTYTCIICNSTKSEKFVFAGVSEEKWNTAIQLSNFDNVTFSFKGYFLDDLSASNKGKEFSYVCKVNEDSATMNGDRLESESVAGLKSVYINTAIAIVEDFAKFIYDKDSETYKSNQDIVYNVTVMGYEATITAKDVSVVVDTNSNIASISCIMIQSFEENGSPKQYTLDIAFNYSDYGTTVIE